MQLPLASCSTIEVCFHGIVFHVVLILSPVSSLTFLVWHFFVTLDDEVQYIWTCVTSLVVIQDRFLMRVFVLQYA